MFEIVVREAGRATTYDGVRDGERDAGMVGSNVGVVAEMSGRVARTQSHRHRHKPKGNNADVLVGKKIVLSTLKISILPFLNLKDICTMSLDVTQFLY